MEAKQRKPITMLMGGWLTLSAILGFILRQVNRRRGVLLLREALGYANIFGNIISSLKILTS